MITHSLVQKSPDWVAYRFEHDNASEAAAMLGLSTKMTRTELLHMKHVGSAREFSDYVQTRVLDHGHAVEALARPIVERIIGEDLYPVTCSLGKLSASCDGLTMDESKGWEHKQWNQALAEAVAAGDLPDEYMPQPQQCMLVTGASEWIFTVSDGTEENMVRMTVRPDPVWSDRIVKGWEQFARDLAAYVPAAVVIEAVGHTPETLPALRVEVTGMVTASNLAEYKEHALAVIGSINRDIQTDQDFANAAKAVKWCGDVESRLEAVKQHALSQTESIDVLFKTIDDIKAKARETRLELDNLVKRRNTERKDEIILGGKSAYQTHLDGLKAETEGLWVVLPTPDFAGSIKGMRLLANMQDAVNTLLANSKITADDSAKKIRANLACIKEDGKDFEFLFSDRFALIGKALDDLKLLVKSRIAEHQAAEDKKAEALRESIRAEELAKIESTNAAAAPVDIVQAAIETVAPTVPVRYTMVPAAPKPTAPPTLALGEISTRLGFNVTSVFLASLGFEATTVKAAKLFHSEDLSAIGLSIIEHVRSVLGLQSISKVLATDKAGIAAQIADHNKAIAALEQQIDSIDSALENNVYVSHDAAERAIFTRYKNIASEACEGSYCCGNREYRQQYKLKGDATIFEALVTFEYNRHDKTYYYIDGIDYSFSVFSDSAETATA